MLFEQLRGARRRAEDFTDSSASPTCTGHGRSEVTLAGIKLEMLSLGGLQWPYARSIGGDASAALAPCKRLRVLSLMGTAITGDIGGFAQFAELNGLFLQASGVTGCLASLGGLNKLRDVDVCYTAVHSTQAELEEFDEDHPKCIVHHQWGYDTERTVSIDEFEDEEEYFERFGNSSASRYSHNGRICWKAHAEGFPSIHEFSEPLSERSIYSSISREQLTDGETILLMSMNDIIGMPS